MCFPNNPSPYVLLVPYPQRLQKAKLDKQFTKFLEVFKKLHINIPFVDALAQMPNYVKFVKKYSQRKGSLKNSRLLHLLKSAVPSFRKSYHQS